MKKLIFLIAMLGCLVITKAQSTIIDNGTYITLQYANGDTICVGKDMVDQILDHNNKVFLMTSRKWDPGPLTKIVTLDVSDFGFATSEALRSYLATVCFRAYRETYVYTGGNLDTIKYYHGISLQHMIVYTYDDGVVISKSIVNSQ
ncbi:MAG: hypothetical protein V2B15_08565 [Bacteroidota bacterium]